MCDEAAREPGDRRLRDRQRGAAHEVRHRHLPRLELRRGRIPRGRPTCWARRPCSSGTRITTCRARRRHPARRLQLRRLPARRRHRALQPDHAEVVAHADRGGPVHRRSATDSRSPARPDCCPARCCATRACSSSASWCALRVENDRHAVHEPVRARARSCASRSPTATGATPPMTTTLDRLEAERAGRVPLRERGRRRRSDAANPNGSMRGIAGIVNERGNVLGLMPHPERAVESVARLRRRPRAVRVGARARRASELDRSDLPPLDLNSLALHGHRRKAQSQRRRVLREARTRS